MQGVSLDHPFGMKVVERTDDRHAGGKMGGEVGLKCETQQGTILIAELIQWVRHFFVFDEEDHVFLIHPQNRRQYLAPLDVAPLPLVDQEVTHLDSSQGNHKFPAFVYESNLFVARDLQKSIREEWIATVPNRFHHELIGTVDHSPLAIPANDGEMGIIRIAEPHLIPFNRDYNRTFLVEHSDLPIFFHNRMAAAKPDPTELSILRSLPFRWNREFSLWGEKANFPSACNAY